MGGGEEDGAVGMDDSISAVLQASSMMIEKKLMQLTEWILGGGSPQIEVSLPAQLQLLPYLATRTEEPLFPPP